MGKGDKKSKKGKRWRGSYGVSRPSRKKKTATVKKAAAPKAEKPKKTAAKKTAKKAE